MKYTRTLMVGLMLIAAAPLALGQDAEAKAASLREAARVLASEVGRLQEDLAAELTGVNERTLYRQADAVLGEVDRLAAALKGGTSDEQLAKEFIALDRKVHQLLSAVQKLGPDQRRLQRSAARVAAADEELHFAFWRHDTTPAGKSQLLARQARALAAATARLDETAQYALGDTQGRSVLTTELHQLAVAAAEFQKGMTEGTALAPAQKDFAAVSQAWSRAIRGLDDLMPMEHVYLLQAAGRVDVLHQRLFCLLGLEGEPPRLRIRT